MSAWQAAMEGHRVARGAGRQRPAPGRRLPQIRADDEAAAAVYVELVHGFAASIIDEMLVPTAPL